MSFNNEWKIRKANVSEFQAVRGFYHQLIDELEGAQYSAGWEKDVYPANEYLQESLENGQLYVGVKDGQIMGAMILNHDCNESYNKVQFGNDFAPDKIMVIHALGVMPSHGARGYGKKLVQEAVELAKAQNLQAIRLDVLKGNLPAEKLYTAKGFVYIDVVTMFYEDTGWTDYEVYEYVL